MTSSSPPAIRSIADHLALVQALRDPAVYPHPADAIEVVGTHASTVVLAGPFAYKLKKPVDLGFLDFGTLEKRRRLCEEEVRLNRRQAASLYLDVVPVTGTPDAPRIEPGRGGKGAIEYAVRMRRFDQAGLFERLLAHGELRPAHIDALAEAVAAFHRDAARASADDVFGDPQTIRRPMAENFTTLRPLLQGGGQAEGLDALEAWSEAEWRRLAGFFARRKQEGFVRECHGDLHSGNVVLIGGAPVVFDCIEFNPALRWTDVMADVAFMSMDLGQRGRPDLAARFVDRYAQASGDYEGLAALTFYGTYRAMVRAKVNAILGAQEGASEAQRTHAQAECTACLAHAAHLAAPRPRALLLMHGVSGSGKTVVSQHVLEDLGAVRLRSDVERKRAEGLPALARTRSGLGAGLYGADKTTATYARLAALARGLLGAGFPVVVDATFLARARREPFRRLAREMGVLFLIIDCQAPEPVLRARVAARLAAAGDASEADIAVLRQQLVTAEPLTPEEEAAAVVIDTTGELPGDLPARIRDRLGMAA